LCGAYFLIVVGALQTFLDADDDGGDDGTYVYG